MKEGDVPGLALVVVRDGRTLWKGSFGVRDGVSGAPVDDETVFEAASLSKPVFAYLVLKLVDAGRLDLDASLTKYLPGDYLDDPNPNPRLPLITARRVLSHTTGFPNWRPDGRPLEIHFTPGERFSYSGEGFLYLQKAVERLTGQTLDALAKRLVFDPLQMKSTSYVWEERFEGRKARGHDASGDSTRISRPFQPISAASLHTTAADYARFLIAALDGSGLAPGSAALWLTPQIHVDEGCSNCIAGKPTGRLSSELSWGLGWGLEQTADGTAIWHWGDNGNFHCFVAGYPKQRLGVVIFTNSSGGHGIIPDIVPAAIGGRHPASAWIGYERYDSPARVWFQDILARGVAAVSDAPRASAASAAPPLTEQQVNQIGYWLLARKKTKEAVAVFEKNVTNFPDSWNVYDSVGEAYGEDGQRERALASYERSLALNPKNTNGVDAIRKLKEKKP